LAQGLKLRRARHWNWILLLGLLCVVVIVTLWPRLSSLLSEQALEKQPERTPSSFVSPEVPSGRDEGILPSSLDGSAGRQSTSSPAQRLTDGEFPAWVDAVASGNVLLRNRALNEFQNLAKNDSNLPALRDALLALDAEGVAFAPFVAALGAVGTPAAQRVLTELVSRRGSEWRAFSAVVPVFGLLEAPTDEDPTIYTLLVEIKEMLGTKLTALQDAIDSKPGKVGVINIEGTVDGVPAVIDGVYEIV